MCTTIFEFNEGCLKLDTVYLNNEYSSVLLVFIPIWSEEENAKKNKKNILLFIYILHNQGLLSELNTFKKRELHQAFLCMALNKNIFQSWSFFLTPYYICWISSWKILTLNLWNLNNENNKKIWYKFNCTPWRHEILCMR